jgi:hypothetical protein
VPVSKRSDAQNRLLWKLLGQISEQLEWAVDGRIQKLSAEDWKHILSAGVHKHQRVAMGIDGGFVILGQYTSKMTVEQMADLLTFVIWFCDEKGVKLSAEDYSAYREWQ